MGFEDIVAIFSFYKLPQQLQLSPTGFQGFFNNWKILRKDHFCFFLKLPKIIIRSSRNLNLNVQILSYSLLELYKFA